jgi:hypothetical protein
VRRKKVTAHSMILSGGVLNFRRAVRHAARFGAACSEAGRLLTFAEYVDRGWVSRAQAYKDLAAWRACCGELSVLDVVSSDALDSRGFTEEEREEVIARQLAGR